MTKNSPLGNTTFSWLPRLIFHVVNLKVVNTAPSGASWYVISPGMLRVQSLTPKCTKFMSQPCSLIKDFL